MVSTDKKKGHQKILLILSLFLGGWGQWELSSSGTPGTLIPGLVLYGMAVLLFLSVTDQENLEGISKAALPASLEWGLFGAVVCLACGLRFFRIGEIPEGLYLDVSGPGYLALRVLKEQWIPPFILPPFSANPSYLVYLLSFWFRLLPADQTHLIMFFTVYSIAALPLIYWAFRQLAGPRLALTTLFLLAVMRWHVSFSRDGFRGIQILFYMFGTLSLLLLGLKAGKRWPYVVASLFFAGGLYTYQSYKIFPVLVLLYLLYEYFLNPEAVRQNRNKIVLFGLFFLLLVFPILRDWIQTGTVGQRESAIFIGSEMARLKSFQPLWEKLSQTLLMYNRTCIEVSQFNYQDHRCLDDVTGLFFVIGFFWALFRIKERAFFYSLTGLVVMGMPGFLSSEPAQVHRMLGQTPFVAFIAATAMFTTYEKAVRFFPRQRKLWVIAGFLVLFFCAAKNIKDYFIDQANDYDHWKGNSIEATTVGKRVLAHPETFYFLAPIFYEHYTVRFLDYGQTDRLGLLDPARLDGISFPAGFKEGCFVLDEGKGPTMEFLKKHFPGGQEDDFKDKNGRTLAFFYYFCRPFSSSRMEQGLKGEYYGGDDASGRLWAQRIDPLINFTTRADFPVPSLPIYAQWTGRIIISHPGKYGFSLLTRDPGRIWIDGELLFDMKGRLQKDIILRVGKHDVRLEDHRSGDFDFKMDYHFLWMEPGKERWEVVPSEVLGRGNP